MRERVLKSPEVRAILLERDSNTRQRYFYRSWSIIHGKYHHDGCAGRFFIYFSINVPMSEREPKFIVVFTLIELK